MATTDTGHPSHSTPTPVPSISPLEAPRAPTETARSHDAVADGRVSPSTPTPTSNDAVPPEGEPHTPALGLAAIAIRQQVAALQAFEQVSLGVVTLDREMCVTGWNRCAAELFGVSSSRALGRQLAKVLAPLGHVCESLHERCQRVFLTAHTARLLDVPVALDTETPLAARETAVVAKAQSAAIGNVETKGSDTAEFRRARTRRASTRLHGIPSSVLKLIHDTSIIRHRVDAIYLDFVIDPLFVQPEPPEDPAALPADRATEAASTRADPAPLGPDDVRGLVLTVHDATDRSQLRVSLESKTADLEMMFRVSNALRGTMLLDDALFISLSAMTAAKGGGFDKAFLFLADSETHRLRGELGVESLSLETARAIWTDIAKREDTLPELLRRHDPTVHDATTRLTKALRAVEYPLERDAGVIARAVLDQTSYTEKSLLYDPELHVNVAVQHFSTLRCFAVVPLLIRDRALGALVLDSSTQPRAWSKELIGLLELYAHQCALAIENAQVYERAVRESHTDALTGLYNHGYFQQELRRAVGQAERYGNPVALVMVDIDHFKRFNDTWGHPAGDKILALLAAFFRESTRETDLAARYGGEEFAVLMPHTGGEEAYRIAERLRQRVSDELHFVDPKGERHPLTASFGVAAYPEHAADAATLLAYADAALYRAKRQGRNRTIMYEPHDHGR